MPVGTVTAFDQARGVGEITSADRAHPFHIIDIADGTRAIDTGIAVRFQVRPKLGRYEAVRIRPVT